MNFVNLRALHAPLAAVLASAFLSAHPLAAASDKELRSAAVPYQNGEWGEAFSRISKLADAGHADAARIALFMHRYGPEMYGRYWTVPEPRLVRWQSFARETRFNSFAPAKELSPGRTEVRERTRR